MYGEKRDYQIYDQKCDKMSLICVLLHSILLKITRVI